jgi:hypothetical protein
MPVVEDAKSYSASPVLASPAAAYRETEFFIDNLPARIHYMIVMIRKTGLAPWEFPFPGSIMSTILVSYSASPVLASPAAAYTHGTRSLPRLVPACPNVCTGHVHKISILYTYKIVEEEGVDARGRGREVVLGQPGVGIPRGRLHARNKVTYCSLLLSKLFSRRFCGGVDFLTLINENIVSDKSGVWGVR